MQPLIVVTGASRGIGFAIAKELGKRGAFVVGSGRNEPKWTPSEFAPGKFHFIRGDICQKETGDAIARFIESQQNASIQFTGIINNAGVLDLQKIVDVSMESWKRVFDVNLFSVLQLSQILLPLLQKQTLHRWPKIINISTGASQKPSQGLSSYCCSKAALNMLTAQLALEFPNVLSVAIRPGVVKTDMIASILNEGKKCMNSDQFAYFEQLSADDKMLDPEVPGQQIAQLALSDVDEQWKNEFNGKFMSWDDAHLAQLQ